MLRRVGSGQREERPIKGYVMMHRSVHYHRSGVDMTSSQLTALPDGPYRVDGDVTILDRDGRAMPSRVPPVHLCRCGRSADKPFCDGSHARTGWKDEA